MLLICALIVAALAFWSVLSPLQKDRYLSLVSDETQGSATAHGRIQGMINEFYVGLQRPIFGHGLGTTGEAKVHVLGGRRQAAHNLYAELLMEIGIIGMIIFLMFMKSVYGSLVRNKKMFDRGAVDNPFFIKANSALVATFWMYAVYSINYWGLSVYYWYLIGGLSIAFGRLLLKVAPPEVSIVKNNYRLNG